MAMASCGLLLIVGEGMMAVVWLWSSIRAWKVLQGWVGRVY